MTLLAQRDNRDRHADMPWQVRSAFDISLCHIPADLLWMLYGDVIVMDILGCNLACIGLSDLALCEDVC